MINKIINYVWVGGKSIPDRIKKIIENNQRVLGEGWKTKIWTEKDFDIESNPFTKYWYQKKQWAFVSDYIRAYAVYNDGGFYLDTDVVLTKTLDDLIKYNYVASRTNVAWNTMSIFGATQNHIFLKKYMEVCMSEKMISKPPRIMSTHIHSFVLSNYLDIPDRNEDFFYNNIAILKESKLQLDLKDGENISIHEHHDNWKGTSDLNVSKYYFNKVKFYNGLTIKKISKESKSRVRFNKKISKLIG